MINTGLLSSRIWEGIIQRSHIEGLILNGDETLLQVKRKQSEEYIEMRIMFFHFAPDISINTEFFYWEIMTLLLKIHKMRVCQDIKSVTYTAAAKSLQPCPTLCDPIDSSPPGSPVPGILQARTLEWVAISFSNA